MIAYDNSDQTTGNGASARTFTFTVGAGTSRILLVTGWFIVGAFPVDPLPTLTYNGISMTLLQSLPVVAGSVIQQACWYLIAPTSGGNNLVITPASGKTIGSTSSFFAIVSYSGVSQSSPFPQGGFNNAGTGTGTSFNRSLTTTVDSEWVFGCLNIYSAGVTETATTGTLRQQLSMPAAGLTGSFIDHGPITPPSAGSAIAASVVASQSWSGWISAISPSADLGAPVQSMIL